MVLSYHPSYLKPPLLPFPITAPAQVPEVLERGELRSSMTLVPASQDHLT